MHTIQLNIDDSILSSFMESLDALPKDKIEIISDVEHKEISFEEPKALNPSDDLDINSLLRENGLSHFVYYEEGSRIVYTHDSGTPMQREDFVKIKTLLKDNNINHHDMGLDVLMIEKD